MPETLPSAISLAYTGIRKLTAACTLASWTFTENVHRYMFHQANMRVSDVPSTTVNGKTGQFSLLMTWLEVVTTEMTRL